MTEVALAQQHLSVAEVARAADVSPSAVRFYEAHGLVRAVRTSGNQRRFDPSASCRIRVAKVGQRVGLTVREIAEILAGLPGDPRPEDWARVADRLQTEANRRITELAAALEDIGSGRRLCEL
jgi:MerR family transcriptional regulator, redox-sensitive transcriptional activator SoxR